MCFRTLIANGVHTIRFTEKEGKTKPMAPRRDADEVAKKKAILRRKAQLPAKKAKRARRSQVKKEKNGIKILRRMKLITH